MNTRVSCDNETVCSLRSNRGLPIELSHARLFVSRIGDKREEAENRRMILLSFPPSIFFPIYIFDLNSRDIRGNICIIHGLQHETETLISECVCTFSERRNFTMLVVSPSLVFWLAINSRIFIYIYFFSVVFSSWIILICSLKIFYFTSGAFIYPIQIQIYQIRIQLYKTCFVHVSYSSSLLASITRL